MLSTSKPAPNVCRCTLAGVLHTGGGAGLCGVRAGAQLGQIAADAVRGVLPGTAGTQLDAPGVPAECAAVEPAVLSGQRPLFTAFLRRLQARVCARHTRETCSLRIIFLVGTAVSGCAASGIVLPSRSSAPLQSRRGSFSRRGPSLCRCHSKLKPRLLRMVEASLETTRLLAALQGGGDEGGRQPGVGQYAVGRGGHIPAGLQRGRRRRRHLPLQAGGQQPAAVDLWLQPGGPFIVTAYLSCDWQCSCCTIRLRCASGDSHAILPEMCKVALCCQACRHSLSRRACRSGQPTTRLLQQLFSCHLP